MIETVLFFLLTTTISSVEVCEEEDKQQLELLEDILSSNDEEIIEAYCDKTTTHLGDKKLTCTYSCPGLGSCTCNANGFYCNCMSLSGSSTIVYGTNFC